MSEREETTRGGVGAGPFDRDVSVRAIGIAALLLIVVCVVALLSMGGLLGSFERRALRADPEPPPMLEARQVAKPPEPRLQDSPPADLARIREQERFLLENYGWVDRSAGLVRIPITKAMELLAARGLPVRAEPAEAAPDGAGPEGPSSEVPAPAEPAARGTDAAAVAGGEAGR